MTDVKQAMLDDIKSFSWTAYMEEDDGWPAVYVRDVIGVISKHLEGMVIVPEFSRKKMIEDVEVAYAASVAAGNVYADMLRSFKGL